MSRITIQETKKGFTFHLQAGNGKIIGTSELYNTKEACKKGASSLKANAKSAEVDGKKSPKFEVYTDRAGQFRFALTAKNGEKILASEGYTTKAACLHGVESVKENATTAEVVEM
jgi:uncharacterized protein YegP (UPF0339 family)